MAEPRVQFSFKAYRRPFRVPVRTHHGGWEARDGILLRVVAEDGRRGFGEIAPIERFGTETLAGAVAWCVNVGSHPDLARLRGVPRQLPCCAAGVAAALRELDAAASAEPAREGSLPVAGLLPAGSAAMEELVRLADAGFTTFKLKIAAGDPVAEEALVERLVGRLPPGGRLRLDANGGLGVAAASRWLDRVADWPVEFIEQPLAVAADRDLLRLAHDHRTAVALDESVRGADDIKRWRDRGWPGIFVIKPALAGAPDELLDEVRLAPEPFAFSSALETAIGLRGAVALAFAGGIKRALGFGVGAFFADDGLGGGWAKPVITSAESAAASAEAVWNQL